MLDWRDLIRADRELHKSRMLSENEMAVAGRSLPNVLNDRFSIDQKLSRDETAANQDAVSG
jgi:hypothetical protein